MPTELNREAELRIDTLLSAKEIQERVSHLEQDPSPLVTVFASFESLSNIRTTLLALRAADLGCVLLIEKPSSLPSTAEKQEALALLRDWDQLMLHNALAVLGAVFTEKSLASLQHEARIESKWFKEWVVGSHDPRMMKYPGIPWRSFIRKAVAENYSFAIAVLENEGEGEPLDALVASLLSQKKQAVNIFPKKWKRSEEASH